MKIYVINLDRSPAGWAFVAEQFGRIGLKQSIVRFSAIDARAQGFTSPGYRPHTWRDRWELKSSEQGIFESHRALWSAIATSHPEGGVICEDDILVSADMRDVLNRLHLNRLGIVKLDGAPMLRHFGQAIEVDGLRFREIADAIPSAGCYALSQDAAHMLYRDSETYCETLDDFVFRRRSGLRPMQIWPAIAVQPVYCAQSVETLSWMPDSIMQSERSTERDAALSKGPFAYRLVKEARRSLRKFRQAVRGSVGTRPPLADDLPEYA